MAWAVLAGGALILTVIGGIVWLVWDLSRRGTRGGYTQAQSEQQAHQVEVVEAVREAERQAIPVGTERVERARARVRKSKGGKGPPPTVS